MRRIHDQSWISIFRKRIFPAPTSLHLRRPVHSDPPPPTADRDAAASAPATVGAIQPTLQAEFTCNKCHTRQTKRFSRHAYERGVVIVRCSGCSSHHLFADHLGWIDDGFRTIEDFLRARGETVRRGLHVPVSSTDTDVAHEYLHVELDGTNDNDFDTGPAPPPPPPPPN